MHLVCLPKPLGEINACLSSPSFHTNKDANVLITQFPSSLSFFTRILFFSVQVWPVLPSSSLLIHSANPACLPCARPRPGGLRAGAPLSPWGGWGCSRQGDLASPSLPLAWFLWPPRGLFPPVWVCACSQGGRSCSPNCDSPSVPTVSKALSPPRCPFLAGGLWRR